MSPASNSEARKRGTTDPERPEPIEVPEPFILTTMEEVRRVRNGRVTLRPNGHHVLCAWHNWDFPAWEADETVLWCPSPPRTVTIELPEDVARRWARHDVTLFSTERAAVASACRDALGDDQ